VTSVNCRLAAPWVTALGSGDDVSFGPVRSHIDTCLYCQASIARQRRLRRSLEDLATVPESSPAFGFPRHVEDRSTLRRQLVVGAVGAVVAVGIGVVGLRRTLVH
jgi:hypothetical protein